MLRQEADPLGVKKVLVKMINRHALQFENTNNRDLRTFNITCWCCFALMSMFTYNLYVICVDVYVCQF